MQESDNDRKDSLQGEMMSYNSKKGDIMTKNPRFEGMDPEMRELIETLHDCPECGAQMEMNKWARDKCPKCGYKEPDYDKVGF